MPALSATARINGRLVRALPGVIDEPAPFKPRPGRLQVPS
jgi:hypothetical protein